MDKNYGMNVCCAEIYHLIESAKMKIIFNEQILKLEMEDQTWEMKKSENRRYNHIKEDKNDWMVSALSCFMTELGSYYSEKLLFEYIRKSFR